MNARVIANITKITSKNAVKKRKSIKGYNLMDLFSSERKAAPFSLVLDTRGNVSKLIAVYLQRNGDRIIFQVCSRNCDEQYSNI